MYNFFVNEGRRAGDIFTVTGADCNHIKNVLRMREGEQILVSEGGKSHLCEIESISEAAVTAKVLEENYRETELPVKIYLFQGLPKSDKMELIIQKAVELGVYEIVPVEMHRSVVKLDEKKKSMTFEKNDFSKDLDLTDLEPFGNAIDPLVITIIVASVVGICAIAAVVVIFVKKRNSQKKC